LGSYPRIRLGFEKRRKEKGERWLSALESFGTLRINSAEKCIEAKRFLAVSFLLAEAAWFDDF
jgi:hypothetical protein